jgi:transposase
MTRAYGRAPTHERVYGSVPKNWGDNVTLSAGLTSNGLIAPLRLVGAMNSDIFEAYIEQFVVPELRPGDVVVMDNLSAHKRASIGALIAGAGAELVYLPPYSPDLNPIEMIWSKVKSVLRTLAARTFETLSWSRCAPCHLPTQPTASATPATPFHESDGCSSISFCWR